MPSHFSASVLARNHVVVHGPSDAHAVVFAHGFGCDQNMWRFVEPAFRDRFRTVLFDYVGLGRSDRAAFDAGRYATLDGYAQDLVEIGEALDLRQATIVGHSVSSMIALLASLRASQRFGALVMIGPSPRYIDEPPDYVGGFQRADIDGLLELMDHNYVGWAGALAPTVMGNAERPELAGELEQTFCSTDPVVAKCFARATFYADNRADLAKAKVPALVLQMRDDPIAPPAVGAYVARHLPGSELVLLDASGHCPQMSHPLQTIEAMRPFLDQRLAA
jgi:sigma-B regulation protein RsbQ